MRPRHSSFLLVGVGLALVDCDERAGGVADTGVAVELSYEVLRPVLDAMCDYLDRCGGGADLTSVADCRAALEYTFGGCTGAPPEYYEQVPTLRQGATATDISRCALTYETAPCGGGMGVFPGDPTRELEGLTACLAVLEGHSANKGESCNVSGCRLNLRCRESTNPAACDVCVPRAGPGESCCATYANGGMSCGSSECQLGLTCSGPKQVCHERTPVGSACSNWDECATGFCKNGRCSAAIPIGQPCSEGEPCADSGRCTDGTCQAVYQAGLGEDCTTGPTYQPVQCLFPASCVEGVCMLTNTCSIHGEGEPCGLCNPGLICDGLCRTPKQAGETCTSPFQCVESTYCDYASKRCVPKAGLGEPCGAVPCAPSTVCDWSGTGRCVALAGLGQPCSASGGCVPDGGAFCDLDPTSSSPTGTCVLPRPDGQPCHGGDNECAGGHCDWEAQICRDPAACVMP